MKFTVLDRWGNVPNGTKNEVFLTQDNWNDFGFYTFFGIFYVDDNGVRHDLSGINIAFIGQGVGDRVYDVGQSFQYIGDDHFSMGSSEKYYEKLSDLGASLRNDILNSLNDIAKKNDVFEKVQGESVLHTSFFRSLHPSTVTGQFRRMANGGAKLTPYTFNFELFPSESNQSTVMLDFHVLPESLPPTNIHVLIGRNGVGKTTLIKQMIDSLTPDTEHTSTTGKFTFHENPSASGDSATFANLIFVSFSAFDEILPKPQDAVFLYGIKYSYIGLKNSSDDKAVEHNVKNLDELTEDFVDSLSICRSRNVIERWVSGISTLGSDPNFRNSNLESLINIIDRKAGSIIVKEIFRNLSSGHKIVLLTITKLIEKLQERSLLIMDEPEGHLHPPLLSAFIRCISDLLISTNGVAIMATHSPVILQEVPRSCVWKLNRSGSLMTVEKPERETFGENVGILTNEIFRLETTEAGFYKMLANIAKVHNYNYETVLSLFGGQLGMEGRSILMAIVSTKGE
jgi:predicted ATPase